MKVRMYVVATGETLGIMSDEPGEPHADTPGVDELLASGSVGSNRRERFELCAAGYSNGYCHEIIPD